MAIGELQISTILRKPIVRAGAFITLSLFAGLLLLGNSMISPFSHDEHQFIVGARLFADQGSLPYLDFPHNHMPYLVFVYGFLFKLVSANLLTARLVSVAASIATVGMLGWISWRMSSKSGLVFGWLSVVGTILIIIGNPFFIFTSGKAWNHDLPTALVLGATLLVWQSYKNLERRWHLILSGLLVGAAIGLRLSYIFAVPAIVASVLLFREGRRFLQPILRLLAFGVGLIIALLPALALYASSPDRFLFGNLGYQALNTEYRFLLDHNIAMTLAGKVEYLFGLVVDKPSNLIMLIAAALAVWLWSRRERIEAEARNLSNLALLMAMHLFIGAFISTPSWPQYFYAPIPFLVLASLVTLSDLGSRIGSSRWGVGIFGIMSIASLAAVIQYYSPIDSMRAHNNWVPLEARRLGRLIADEIGKGTVLTLAPLIPLEAGLAIYPEFATGPLIWRISPLMGASEREAIGVISPDELSTLLKDHPPAAVLIGFEAGNEGFRPGEPFSLENPLINYARDAGFHATKLRSSLISTEIILWHP